MNKPDAAGFTRHRTTHHYFKQFHEFIRLILFCYNKIRDTEFIDIEKIQKEKKIALEDFLKYNLVDYLRKNKRHFPVIRHVLIIAESGEYNSRDDKESFCDIAVYFHDHGFVTEALEHYTIEEDIYFAFECKRLKHKSKNSQYIEQGIKRYVENAYAGAMPFAGMIGFVEAGEIHTIVNDINQRLSSLHKDDKLISSQCLCFFEFDTGFEYSFQSKHPRTNNNEIALYHIFLDYRFNAIL